MKSVHSQKRDSNEKAIVDALRKRGCFVQRMTQGAGVVDLFVGHNGLWHALEVKDPTASKKLTDKQIHWILDIKNRAPVHVVETVEQAFSIVGC